MSSDDIKTRLVAKLHKLLHNDFWEEFMEAIAEEMVNMDDLLQDKREFNNIELVDSDRLIQIAEKMGYTPNLIIDNSQSYIKNEVQLIPYRITNKSTTNGFILPFRLIEENGQVFNLFYDSTSDKLIRGYDEQQTILNLNSYVYGDVFLGFAEETYLLPVEEGLDSTQHLALEYQADSLYTYDEAEYLFYPDYFNYLSYNSDYNRKLTTTPHNGVNVSMVIDESGLYNHNNQTDEFTINDLKIRASISPEYYIQITQSFNIQLDTSRTLDETTPWTLDEAFNTPTPLDPENFQYVVAGIGSKPLYSYSTGLIYSDVLFHYGFDEEDGLTVYDESFNKTNAVVTGTTKRITGIISRTLDFDGSTYATLATTTIPYENLTFQFWVQKDSTIAGVQPIYDGQFLTIDINSETSVLNIMLTDGSNTVNFSSSSLSDDDDIHLYQIEIDNDNTNLNVFRDAELIDTTSIATIGDYSGTYISYFGYNRTTPTYFNNGLLDDMLMNIGLFSSSDKTFIYENRVGSLLSLDNRIYRALLSREEIYTDDNITMIQSYISSNTVKGQSLGVGDGATQNFAGSLLTTNVKPGTFKLSYDSAVLGEQTAEDDGQGLLLGDRISGTIDYTNGTYDFDTTRTFIVIQEETANASYTTLNYTLESVIQTSSYSIDFFIDGVRYTGIDNGSGTISGDNIDSGTIDYNTGDVSITFTEATDDYYIWTSYTYTKEDTVESDIEIFAEYKTSNDLEITEFGIEDANNQLLIYTTCPPCKFGTDQSHLSIQYLINKNT